MICVFCHVTVKRGCQYYLVTIIHAVSNTRIVPHTLRGWPIARHHFKSFSAEKQCAFSLGTLGGKFSFFGTMAVPANVVIQTLIIPI